MYQRPLFAAATGFVLGEVCAWQAESGNGQWMFFLGLLFFGVLVLHAVCSTEELTTNKKRKKEEKGRGRHEVLWVLLLLCLFFAGYGRMAWEIREWRKVESRVWENGEVVSFTGKLEKIQEKEKTTVLTLKTRDWGRVLVYVEKEAWEGLHIGERVNVKGEVSHFQEARNPGEFDRKSYYRSCGVSTAIFAWTVKAAEEGSTSPYLDGLYRFRCFCSRVFSRICEPEDEGIFRAVILGEKEGMDQEIKDLYQKNGIAHLLAISGLHLSLLGAALHRILRRCGLGYGSAGCLAAVGMFSYALLTGASGSAVRAVIMLLASFLAAYWGRTYDLLSALSLAALLLSGARPFSIIQSGFQLSFGAVLGIGVLGKAVEDGLGLKTKWMKTFMMSLSLQLATAPVVLWHYYELPAYGILLNLVVVPLMGYVVISGLFGLIIGSFAVWAGVMAVGTGHYILWFYQVLCTMTSRFPGYLLIWGRPKGVQIALYYLILGGMVLGLTITGEKASKRKTSENRRKAVRWGIVAAGVVLCIGSVKPRPQSGLDIAVLDVGQGDGIVLQCPGGRGETKGILWLEEGRWKKSRQRVILMDGGSSSEKLLGENRLEPYLKSQGISRIDFAIVSHGDEDHIRGLRYLLKECPEIAIGCLILPEAGIGDKGYETLIDAAKIRGTAVGYMDAGDQIWAGDCTLTCFYPGKDMEADFSDRNQQSLVIRADYQDFHMLFTGDVGQEGEMMALDRAGTGLASIQVLKAAHHGSRFSSGEAFLAAVHPQWTIISYGEGNTYGHPHEETLERLKNEGSLVLETGTMGAILLHVEDGKARYRKFLTEYGSP